MTNTIPVAQLFDPNERFWSSDEVDAHYNGLLRELDLEPKFLRSNIRSHRLKAIKRLEWKDVWDQIYHPWDRAFESLEEIHSFYDWLYQERIDEYNETYEKKKESIISNHRLAMMTFSNALKRQEQKWSGIAFYDRLIGETSNKSNRIVNDNDQEE